MATIPEQYESQRVGVQGYRVLNLDLDGVCADYKGRDPRLPAAAGH